MSQRAKARSVFLAGSTACLAIGGAWYGASLKENQEIKQKEKANRQATTAEKLAVLEETKARLTARKAGLEDKIAQLESRAAGRGEQKTQGRPFHGVGGE